MGQSLAKQPNRSSAGSQQTPNVENSPRLYVAVPKEAWPLIYSAGYNISFAGMEKLHPFDAGKWGKVHQFLIDRKLLSAEEFIEPLEADETELLVVHTQRYLRSLNWSANVAMITEIPPVALLPNFLVQRSVLRPFRLQTGGTILAGKLAIERGWAMNIGGGFHHCAADRGGGFCAYADITLNINYLWQNFPDIQRVLIVDLDAHQGNGYARDFLGEERVYIFDMYNGHIYPGDEHAKKAISCKVELTHGTKDQTYLDLLKKNLLKSINAFSPQYIVYNAGTDILIGDPLGCLDITSEGIIKRDEIVFEAAHKRSIPIVMLTSGGYQRSTARIIADSVSNLHAKNLICGPRNVTQSGEDWST